MISTWFLTSCLLKKSYSWFYREPPSRAGQSGHYASPICHNVISSLRMSTWHSLISAGATCLMSSLIIWFQVLLMSESFALFCLQHKYLQAWPNVEPNSWMHRPKLDSGANEQQVLEILLQVGLGEFSLGTVQLSKAEKAVFYKNSYFDRISIMDNTLEYSPCKCWLRPIFNWLK